MADFMRTLRTFDPPQFVEPKIVMILLYYILYQPKTQGDADKYSASLCGINTGVDQAETSIKTASVPQYRSGMTPGANPGIEAST